MQPLHSRTSENKEVKKVVSSSKINKTIHIATEKLFYRLIFVMLNFFFLNYVENYAFIKNDSVLKFCKLPV